MMENQFVGDYLFLNYVGKSYNEANSYLERYPYNERIDWIYSSGYNEASHQSYNEAI